MVTRAGRFFPTRDGATIADLAGKTLGIVGVGRIGARLAGICSRAFDMRVLAYDPYITPERATELGVEMRDLPDLLAEADFVSVHTPLTPSTRGLIGAPELAGMKRTAYLVNCARGGIVDEAALAEALEASWIAGAGLDVFEKEPPDLGHPLYQLPNLVVTPHVAGGSQDREHAGRHRARTGERAARVRAEQRDIERMPLWLGERGQDILADGLEHIGKGREGECGLRPGRPAAQGCVSGLAGQPQRLAPERRLPDAGDALQHQCGIAL
jgi:phosphoglycerate dehydrogenase-like enzyme